MFNYTYTIPRSSKGYLKRQSDSPLKSDDFFSVRCNAQPSQEHIENIVHSLEKMHSVSLVLMSVDGHTCQLKKAI